MRDRRVENGTLRPEELEALCTPKRERKRFIRAGKGRTNHHAAKHVLRAALDLGHELAAAGGNDSPGVARERAEIARLRGKVAPAASTGATPAPVA